MYIHPQLVEDFRVIDVNIELCNMTEDLRVCKYGLFSE